MGKYDFEMNTESGTIPMMIMEQIVPGAEVLEFGCANGRMTKYMQEVKNCKVSIVELEKEPFSAALAYAEDGICTDIEDDAWKEYYAGRQFDVILFADVLEHLRAPENALAEAKQFLKSDGKVIISIPNIAHNDVIAALFNNSFAYKEIGLLDNTHIHFWGQKEILKLAENSGYFLERLDGVLLPPFMTELKDAGIDVPDALKLLLSGREYNEIYQFLLVLRKSEWAEAHGAETEVLLKKNGSKASASFYWDLGTGYQAGQCAAVFGADEGEVRVFRVADIPEGCVKVRFDPPAEGTFLVDHCQVTFDNGKTCEVLPLNGIPIGDGACLFQADVLAQMEFTVPAGAKSFVLEVQISPCFEKNGAYLAESEKLRRQEAAQYQEMLNDSNAQNIALQATNTQLQATNTQLQTANTQMQEANTQLQTANAQLQTTNAHLQTANAQLQTTNAHLQTANVQLQTANAHLQDENAVSHAQNRQVTEERDKLAEECAKLASDYAAMEAELQGRVEEYRSAYNEACAAYHQLAAAYNAVLNSRSWRVTAPIRAVTTKVRANRFGSLLLSTRRYYRTFGLKLTLKKIAEHLKKRRQFQGVGYDGQGDGPILKLQDMVQSLEAAGASVSMKENIMNMEAGNCVLIVSHELNLTGAPIAAEYMAKSFQSLGKDVLVISPRDGGLRERFNAEGFPTVVFEGVYESDLIKRSASLFELIVLNTNVGAPLARQLSGEPVPVLWWIHEARASYFEAAVNAMPEQLGNNIHVYCVGDYAQRLLSEYRPAYPSGNLLYGAPDQAKCTTTQGYVDLSAAEGKIVFAHVGMLEYRKGQDILAEAIRKLPPEKREQCYFVIVGRQCYPPQYTAVMDLCRDFPENVRYIQELKREEIACLYDRMECMICSSRDDPMPVVVTEALALSRCVICSENTGSAALLRQMSSGLVYKNDDPAELAACIEAIVDDRQNMTTMCHRARETYERYFTEPVFKKNLARIIKKIAPDMELAIGMPELYLPAPAGILREVYGRDILANYSKNGKKNILLLSHELSLTGAPIVLHKMAAELRSQGHNVTILSPYDGALREKFTEDGFPVVIFQDVYDQDSNDFLSACGNSYDLIVINTVVTYRAIFQLSGLLTPVVWWIHDSHASYTYGGFGTCLPAEIPPNVKILCVGSYARKQLLQHYPHYEAGELLYAIDDCAENTADEAPDLNTGKRKLFVIVGTLELRKGQDVAAEAIRSLPQDVLEECQFVFVGKVVEQPMMDTVQALCQDMTENVCYIGTISHDKLIALYRNADCLICSSRDDPMPVVVTEMQALSKPVICSENTGSAALIQKHGGGLIYRNDDPADLAKQISRIADASKKELVVLGKEGRKLYENCFSEKNFAQELRTLVERECSLERKCAMATVSVVIPTYNAGEPFQEMLSRLNAQKGLAKVEIVVVDSGSTDGTQQMALDYGARLIQISQAEFSHSYARNLGARNASGQVLLFMTQDALPENERWVKEMVTPIISGECSAVSCREQCPEGTDLYYRVAAWNHARYLGIDKASQVGKFTPGMNAEDLRKKASLNDISTAIDRTLFHQMEYRHSFAEDLDMGIRILQAGKRIKLCHEPTVIHGHTRPASYYLRRGLAEGCALERIIGAQGAVYSAKDLADMIVTGYGLLQNTLVQLCEEEDLNTVSAFDARLRWLIQQEMSAPKKAAYGQKGADAYVERYVQKLEKLSLEENQKNLDLAHMVLYYWTNVLSICLKETGWGSENFAAQVCGCLYKQMSLLMGNLLAHMDPAEPCYAEFQQLADGV